MTFDEWFSTTLLRDSFKEVARAGWDAARTEYVSSEADKRDAERWRKHAEVMQAASLKDALHMCFTLNEDGKAWGIEYVLDLQRYGRGTLGLKAISLAAEQKAAEIFAAVHPPISTGRS